MDELGLLRYEFFLHWAAVIIYVLSTVAFAYAVFFQKETHIRLQRTKDYENNPPLPPFTKGGAHHIPPLEKGDTGGFSDENKLDLGIYLAIAGLVPHSIALGLRWYVSGHGPYLSQHEGFSSIVWMVVVMFLIFAYRVPRLKGIGLVVTPSCFLMMAVGFYKTPGIERLPATFSGIWLVLHITFTKLALGAMLIALGAAVFYLLKERKGETGFYQKLPDLDVLDTYSYKFAGFGFVFWTITVIAGAIWANEAWGRYWGWDPIETWSLITWLLFGIYLHLRRFSRWQGGRAACLMLVCFLFSIVALFVIPLVLPTIHSEFFL